MANTNQAETRTIVDQYGYIRQRMLGNIYVLRLRDAAPDTIDAWYEDCMKVMSRWEPNQRLRYLHDIREAEFVTPHAIDRVTQILRRMRNIPVMDARGAILLTNPLIGLLLGTFFNQRPQLAWQIRFFEDESAAIQWLNG